MKLLTRPAPLAPGSRPASSRRDDLVMVGLCAWLMVGLFLDGYAHQNIPSTLETFFTPWHALFYSGSIAAAAWMVRGVMKNRSAGTSLRDAIPAGYELGMLGLGIFGLGGAIDIVWHAVFGIELQIDALISPPHLAIVTGVLLIVTCPLRAGWRAQGREPGFAAIFAPVASMILAASLLSFMFMYASPFVGPDMAAPLNEFLARTFQGDQFELVQYMAWRGGVVAVLVSNSLFIAPMLLLMRRWSLPFGVITVLFSVLSTLMVSLYAFRGITLAIAGVGAGLAADLLYERMKQRPHLFAAAASLILWSAYVLAVVIEEGLGWPLNLWMGTIFWSALSSWGLALLVFSPEMTPVPSGDL